MSIVQFGLKYSVVYFTSSMQQMEPMGCSSNRIQFGCYEEMHSESLNRYLCLIGFLARELAGLKETECIIEA